MDVHEGAATLRALAAIDININNATMQVFLIVAQRGECLMRDVGREVGLSTAALTRNVSYWTDDIRRGTGFPGLGYIDRRENPANRAQKVLRLTLKGQAFFAEMQASRDGTLAHT
jgi:DNA-binding MarR family transcriptional regulator